MVDFMAKDVLNWQQDIHCGINIKGCSNLPTCRDIYARIWDKEHARQICFIFISVHNLNLISVAQLNILALTEQMGATFLWPHDTKIDEQCSLEASIVKAAIMAVMVRNA